MKLVRVNDNKKGFSLFLLMCLSLASMLFAANTAFAKPEVNYNKPTTRAVRSAVNYTYVGIQLVSQKIDDYSCHQSGLNLNGSFEINSDFFAVGSYTDVDGNRFCGSSTLSVGGGYRTLFDADLSLYATLSFEDTSVDYGDDDSGLVLATGLRTFFNSKLEGKAEVAYHTQYDGSLLLDAGVVYWFHNHLSATGDLSLGTDSNSIAVGLRYNF
jgi:hypothetical protein